MAPAGRRTRPSALRRRRGCLRAAGAWYGMAAGMADDDRVRFRGPKVRGEPLPRWCSPRTPTTTGRGLWVLPGRRTHRQGGQRHPWVLRHRGRLGHRVAREAGGKSGPGPIEYQDERWSGIIRHTPDDETVWRLPGCRGDLTAGADGPERVRFQGARSVVRVRAHRGDREHARRGDRAQQGIRAPSPEPAPPRRLRDQERAPLQAVGTAVDGRSRGARGGLMSLWITLWTTPVDNPHVSRSGCIPVASHRLHPVARPVAYLTCGFPKVASWLPAQGCMGCTPLKGCNPATATAQRRNRTANGRGGR